MNKSIKSAIFFARIDLNYYPLVSESVLNKWFKYLWLPNLNQEIRDLLSELLFFEYSNLNWLDSFKEKQWLEFASRLYSHKWDNWNC